ncbi:DUF3488 and transglutaminase-like domain-containing protein [soil metagenome]
MLLAILVALASYHSLLTGIAWWFVVAGVVVIASLSMAVSHHLARRAVWPPLAGAVAGLFAITLFFAPGSALLFVIPDVQTVRAFVALVNGGMESIATQATPAHPTVGIAFLLAAGFAVITVLVDILAFTVRRPALVGLPLLALIAVPALIDPTVSEPVFFVLLAAAFLVLILASADRRQNRLAVGVGAAAIVGALVLSVALPQVETDDSPSSRLRGYSTGVNPFINLGDDLRRPSPITALTYTTNTKQSQYFTLSVLEDFSVGTWEPSVNRNGETDLSSLGPVPGRADGASVEVSTTKIQVGNVSGGWLPTPYAARNVEGQSGTWRWDPETLTINSTTDTMRGQQYTVDSELAAPTATQLNDTGTEVDRDALATDLTLPTQLPNVISQTARDVVNRAGATTDYQMAVALQNYFQSDAFTYSTTAPVDQGYDGSSANVIATFLQKKAGYCVHFSSAMAMMARTLGIPARIGVGFTTGESSLDLQTRKTVFTVSTDDLHAWPELYFQDAGWVRFEPTPGRGTVPDYGLIDDTSGGATPTSAPSTSPTPTATPSSTATSAATGSPSDSSPAKAIGRVISAVAIWLGIALVVILVLLLPAIVRRSRRLRRFARIRSSGAPLEAWAEVRDTALDLGLSSTDAETPRAFATALSSVMTAAGTDPIARLLTAVESHAFSTGSPGAQVADVRATRVAMLAFASRGDRLRAMFLPASVLGRIRTPVDS